MNVVGYCIQPIFFQYDENSFFLFFVFQIVIPKIAVDYKIIATGVQGSLETFGKCCMLPLNLYICKYKYITCPIHNSLH